jgi:hypothetical protein
MGEHYVSSIGLVGSHKVTGKSDPENTSAYSQQSVVIVPANHPGVKVVRPMKVCIRKTV